MIVKTADGYSVNVVTQSGRHEEHKFASMEGASAFLRVVRPIVIHSGGTHNSLVTSTFIDPSKSREFCASVGSSTIVYSSVAVNLKVLTIKEIIKLWVMERLRPVILPEEQKKVVYVRYERKGAFLTFLHQITKKTPGGAELLAITLNLLGQFVLCVIASDGPKVALFNTVLNMAFLMLINSNFMYNLVRNYDANK